MSAARLLTCLESSDLESVLVDEVKRSFDRQLAAVGRMPLVTRRGWEIRYKDAFRSALDPMSSSVSAIGEPYWGKPDVRFDEGDQRTASWRR